jgi:Na+-driven multidrug efflux pump
MTGTAFAKGANLDSAVKPIVALINSMMGPALALVGAIGSLYCVMLGVKFAKAEEPQEREKAKSHLKNAIIGFVLIFVLILALNLSMEPLINWVENNAKGVKLT